MTDCVALFGGSFDPIHHGHLIVARSVAEQLGCRRVILLPSAHPPHKQADKLLDARHRAEMVRLAIQGDTLFEVSDHDLAKTGPTYTIDTVAHFRAQRGPDVRLCWIIGSDSLAELTTWHRVRELVDACDIVTAARTGTAGFHLSHLGSHLGEKQIARLRRHILKTPRIDISATDIRRRVATGESVRYLVPEAVRTYIAERTLYQQGKAHDT